MAFFEDLSKKLTDAGQGVAQQTKNLAEVARLNSAISGKEKQIAQIYAAIGQAYYQRHRDDPGAEELEQIQAINALQAEIMEHQEEIKQIKGVTKCPECGADVPLNSAFCSACGAKIPEAAPAPRAGRICSSCGAVVPEGDKFCTKCGTAVDAE